MMIIGCASTERNMDSLEPIDYSFDMSQYHLDNLYLVDFGGGNFSQVVVFNHAFLSWKAFYIYEIDGLPQHAVEYRADGFCTAGLIGSTSMTKSDKACVVVADIDSAINNYKYRQDSKYVYQTQP